MTASPDTKGRGKNNFRVSSLTTAARPWGIADPPSGDGSYCCGSRFPRVLTTVATIVRVSLLAIGVALLPTFVQAEPQAYWPQFHGPNRDNISSETGLQKEWSADGPTLLWTAHGLGHGYSSVSMADGRMYTAGNIDGATVITALDMDGKPLWTFKNGPAWEGAHEGTRGTPTIDGDRVYHENPLGDVVCVEARTGRPLWTVNILKAFGSKNIRWALAESLLVDGDRVICCPGGPEACIAALDKMTGKTVWTAKGTGELAGYASPTLFQQDGLRIVVTLNAKAMIGVNADTGELLWRVKHTSLFDENVLQPIYHDGCLFVSSLGNGSVKWKVRVVGNQASVEELWRSKQLDNHHGGVVLVDGHLYGSSALYNLARWICLDWETGEMKYSSRGVGKGSLTYADGMLYTLSKRSKMGLVAATPAGHEVISEFRIPRGGEGPTWAHPVVCGGRLYIRHGEFLYAYDVKGDL
jgi:outer membrane protein assembly factor BamB